MSYQEFCAQYPDEDSLLKKIFEMRNSFKECPNCGHTKPYQKIKGRRGFQCSKRTCSNQIFPLAQTPLRATKLDIRTWIYVIHQFVNSKAGLTAQFLSRDLQITAKTALRMLTVIRMNLQNNQEPLSGLVECDESYFGAPIKNLSNKKRYAIKKDCEAKGIKTPRGRSVYNKTLIFGMIERGGRVIAKIVPDAKGVTLKPLIYKYVTKGSYLLTDEYPVYKSLKHDYIHECCNHKRKNYKSGIASTNGIENYWKCLKVRLRNYVSIDQRYLPYYISESMYLFNQRGNPWIFYDLFCSMVSSSSST